MGKNIFIEGLQGMGKSTLLQRISAKIPEFHVCCEGDYSPVDLAWCTWMSREEYNEILEKYSSIRQEIVENTVREGEKFIITYTRILTDIPGFHKDLERFEIYNGRKSIDDFEGIVLSRYRRFTGKKYLFECALMQNIIENLLLYYRFCDDEILDFYRRLFAVMDRDNFLLVYLYSDKICENIEIIKKERSDAQGNELWYNLLMEYLKNSPYGREKGVCSREDLLAHLRHRQQVELRIVREVIQENAVILPAKEWEEGEVFALLR